MPIAESESGAYHGIAERGKLERNKGKMPHQQTRSRHPFSDVSQTHRKPHKVCSLLPVVIPLCMVDFSESKGRPLVEDPQLPRMSAANLMASMPGKAFTSGIQYQQRVCWKRLTPIDKNWDDARHGYGTSPGRYDRCAATLLQDKRLRLTVRGPNAGPLCWRDRMSTNSSEYAPR